MLMLASMYQQKLRVGDTITPIVLGKIPNYDMTCVLLERSIHLS